MLKLEIKSKETGETIGLLKRKRSHGGTPSYAFQGSREAMIAAQFYFRNVMRPFTPGTPEEIADLLIAELYVRDGRYKFIAVP